MEEFKPTKIDLLTINNGKGKYINGVDSVQADTVNAVVEGTAWVQALGTNQPNNSEADNVGTPSVSIETLSDGTPRLKFTNLKGKNGVDGKDGEVQKEYVDNKVASVRDEIETVYSILGATVVTIDETESKYNSRVTADGANILDGVRTSVKKIKGASVATETEIISTSFKGIESANSNDTITDNSFALNNPVTLQCGDYIDVENQQVVRKTATKAFTNYGINWWWAFNASKGIYAYTIYSSDTITVAMGNEGNNAACVGYSYTDVNWADPSAPNMSFKFDPKNKYFYFKNTAYTTLEAWKAHLVELYEAGTPLTITYETAAVQSTEDITIPSGYKAYKNGTETIVQVNVGETSPSDYGAECTVTQNYYSKMGE